MVDDYDHRESQQWRKKGCFVVSVLDGSVLDVEGESSASGTRLISWPAKSPVATNQQFEFEEVFKSVSYAPRKVPPKSYICPPFLLSPSITFAFPIIPPHHPSPIIPPPSSLPPHHPSPHHPSPIFPPPSSLPIIPSPSSLPHHPSPSSLPHHPSPIIPPHHPSPSSLPHHPSPIIPPHHPSPTIPPPSSLPIIPPPSSLPHSLVTALSAVH